MAKDTIGIGVSNVARLMDSGWIGVDNVAREIDEVWIGDENSKAQLVWKAGVDYLFKGILAQKYYTTQGQTTAYYLRANVMERTESAVSGTTMLFEYDMTDDIADSDIDYFFIHMSCSANGEYFCVLKHMYSIPELIYKRSADGTITELPLDITDTTIGVYNVIKASYNIIPSLGVSGIMRGASVIGAFNEDGTVFVTPILIQKTSTDSQQPVLLVYKNIDGTGFVFDKYIELPSVLSSSIPLFSASQDLSVLAFMLGKGSEQETFILKGSPDGGYTTIHYEYNKTAYYYSCACAQVTTDGQYVLLGYPDNQTGTSSSSYYFLHARLFYISGNTATAIKTCHGGKSQAIFLKKAPDSDILYISRRGGTVGTNSLDSDAEEGIHVYKVSGATITLLGVFGEKSTLGNHVLYDVTNDGNYVLCCTDALNINYCTASRDSTGLITAVTSISTVGKAYSGYLPMTTAFIDYES